ncbi:MAG: glucose-6-phosphate isomerase [Candidatus Eisenbacteria bacterium]
MSGLDLRVGTYQSAIDARLARITAARFGSRLLGRDDALWVDDAEHRKVAANRLGWLDSPMAMQAEAANLAAFTREVVAEGFTHAVLLGMGGSSLAPEVLRLTFGVAVGALELTVLDDTSPAAVRAVADSHDLSRTLFVVASKSGGTIEVVSFEKYFWEQVHALRGNSTGRAFVAITDPGTSLGALAKARGYRHTFVNAPDIGGRYSVLSYFGLVPAALLGVDIPALLASAICERVPLDRDQGEGLRLGAALGELALAGRDKLTLVFSPAIASLGTWIEQLVAESTGKLGRGIVPVAEEALAAPSAYAADRVFLAVGQPSLPNETRQALDSLSAAGHPVIHWDRAARSDLGGEFMRWEIATALAGAVLGVDPFDEPNVSEAKAATQTVLQRYLAEGRFPDSTPAASHGALQAFAPSSMQVSGGDPGAWLQTLLACAEAGDYVAVLAYVHRTAERHALLEAIRHGARDISHLATTLGYGPRFLHSTGQLHKGGPNTGLFLQLTGDEGDLAIPGEKYGFGVLHAAQAAGDFQVLESRGRRVLRVHMATEIDAGLQQLVQALQARTP